MPQVECLISGTPSKVFFAFHGFSEPTRPASQSFIDVFAISEPFTQLVEGVKLIKDLPSDHHAILVDLDVPAKRIANYRKLPKLSSIQWNRKLKKILKQTGKLTMFDLVLLLNSSMTSNSVL